MMSFLVISISVSNLWNKWRRDGGNRKKKVRIPPDSTRDYIHLNNKKPITLNNLVLTKKHSVHNGQDWCQQMECL